MMIPEDPLKYAQGYNNKLMPGTVNDLHNKTRVLLDEYMNLIHTFDSDCERIACKIKALWAIDKNNFIFRENDANDEPSAEDSSSETLSSETLSKSEQG